jgi:phosphatidylinositol-3-phosphatase
MISGQAPNLLTQLDCFFYGDLTPGTIGADGQADGTGCIYPAGVPTIASQLVDSGMTWRDYNEGMGADPIREPSVCGHPGVDALDNTQSATATDQYASRHNPFVYFHSIIDDTTLCDTHVVTLDYLARDLATAANTPNYAFVTPDLCDDAHDATCADGGPGGLTAADAFLRDWSLRRSRLVFTGRAGRRYQFRVRATDVFGASGAWATSRTWSSPRWTCSAPAARGRPVGPGLRRARTASPR